MSDTITKEHTTFEELYSIILAHIDINKPSVHDTLHFIGSLISSSIDMINMSQSEKDFYLIIYNQLITKRIKEKHVK